MSEINFPTWVTNDTAIPSGFNVRAKKLVYVFVAIEKLRILHNAGWKWFRDEELTVAEEDLLAEAFPSIWPNKPTEQQIKNWIENYFDPRSNALQSTRTIYRRAINESEFSYVNLDGIID